MQGTSGIVHAAALFSFLFLVRSGNSCHQTEPSGSHGVIKKTYTNTLEAQKQAAGQAQNIRIYLLGCHCPPLYCLSVDQRKLA